MKIFRLFLISLVLLTAYACKEEEEFRSGRSADVVVTGGIPGTRTSYTQAEDVMHVSWEAQDAIGIFTSKQRNLKYVANQDGAYTSFQADAEKLEVEEGDTVFAYYPYRYIYSDNSFYTYPNESLSANDLLYATGVVHDGTVDLQFHHFYAILQITIPKSVVISDMFYILSSEYGIWAYDLSIDGNQIKITDEPSDFCVYSLSSYMQDTDGEDITFCMPILPQTGGQLLDFYTGDGLLTYICYKTVPAEGLLAGNVYALSIRDELAKADYISSDYASDGEVFTLQTATVGKGIDLVLMGDGFVDTDMDSGGKYEQKMQEATEAFFSYEPYKTFRNRFNVYGVKVVSASAEWTDPNQHAINEDLSVAFEYATKVVGDTDDPIRVGVVYNTTRESVGRSYTTYYSDGSFVGFMMEPLPTAANVLVHEFAGHGFALLLDEYVEGGYEEYTVTEDDKEYFDRTWEFYDWGANTDWRSDPTTVRWARFIADDRYADEGIGVYEGAATIGLGMYRPTENSMMRFNNAPFNAPSREQIYKRIMRFSEGDSWTYDYEDFVAYDAINRNVADTRGVSALPSESLRKEHALHHRPPVRIQGSLRDYLKKNKK
jgi:hypothetical protein